MTKILVSGCSFTHKHIWPNHLTDHTDVEVLNLGQPASGNSRICNSIMMNVDQFDPDFVFILWSGINRIEFRSPVADFFSNHTHAYSKEQIGNSLFFQSADGLGFDRGWIAAYNAIKDQSWPEIRSLKDWFNLPAHYKQECIDHQIYLTDYNGTENSQALVHQYYLGQHIAATREYVSELTFQNIMNCANFLQKKNVPYRFSFIYDIWNNDDIAHGPAVKEHYHDQIDWSKFIDLPPFLYGLKHDLFSEDNYHLTQDGMVQWATEIKKQLKTQPDLAFLF